MGIGEYVLFRTKEVNGVQIRNVNSALIRLWAAVAVLIDIHSKEQNILLYEKKNSKL